mgnify:CR=1 FL=1
MARDKNAIKKKINVLTAYPNKGYKDKSYNRDGYVTLWSKVDTVNLTPKEARKFAKVLIKAAKTAEKVEK